MYTSGYVVHLQFVYHFGESFGTDGVEAEMDVEYIESRW